MKKSQFGSKNLFGHSSRAAMALALMIVPLQTAFAQEAPQEQPEATENIDEGEEIVVTGFRASVESAINTKRSLNFIADIVSADDIAGLPDVSIAESLARLPGVTSQRTGGQASVLNIRGLGQSLVSSTLNGREQVATSGNRIVEFNQYPSELIVEAGVYKSPIASIIEGGIAAKVELKTVRPLDSKERLKVQANFRGLYNDRADESPDVSSSGYRASGSIQYKITDTLGVAVGYARLFQPNVATRFVQFDFTPPGTNGSPVRDLNGDGRPEIFNFGFEGIQFGGRETRDGAIGVIEWKPNDRLSLLLDGYYSRLQSDVKRRGFRVTATQSRDNQFVNPIIVNDAVLGGRITNRFVPGDLGGAGFALSTELVNQDEGRLDELYTFGGNLSYALTDRIKASADVSYSRGTSFFNNSGVNVQPFVQTATGLRIANTVPGVITVDYQLNGLRLPTIREITTNFTDLTAAGGGFLLNGQFLVPQRDTDELFAVAGDLTFDVDGSFVKDIKLGFRYGNRNGNRVVTTFRTFGIPGGPLELPANLTSTGGFSGNFAAAGFPNFGVVDINGAFNLAFGNTLGTRQPTSQDVPDLDFPIDQSFDIDEDTYAGYAQLDFSTIAGSLPFRGNVGLRVVQTNQSSTVFAVIPTLGSDDRNTVARENRRFVTRGTNFVDFLPSFNAILEFSPQDLVRFSYSRQISRPNFQDLRASISVSSGETNTTGSGGNPSLLPFRANQFDLGFEHYFGRTGIFSVAAFYKDLSSFIISGTIPNFDFVAAGVTPPPRPNGAGPGIPIGIFSAPINGQGGAVYGVEVGFSKTFVELPAPFDGLGVILNYAYSQSDLSTVSTTSGRTLQLGLDGQSDHVFSPTLFYEKSGFGARVSARYRSGFVSPQVGLGDLIVSSASETVVDAQISYEFGKNSFLRGLKLLGQVENLTDEPTRTFFGTEAQTATIQNFGRIFFLGATYKF